MNIAKIKSFFGLGGGFELITLCDEKRKWPALSFKIFFWHWVINGWVRIGRMKKLLIFLTALTLAGHSFADSVSIIEENDFMQKDSSGSTTDGLYTQGLGIQYENTNGWGLALTQIIQTPPDKDSPDPVPEQMPYAGYLYGSYFRHFLTGQQDDYFKVDVGVIGPASGAEDVQTGFHKLTGMALPMGWEHQLESKWNEPVFNIAGFKSYSHRFASWLEYKPFAGVNAGTVLVDAELGNFIRAGWNLPREFNPTIYSFSAENRRMKDQKVFAYVFTGVVGKAIAYDHMLEGSLFQEEQVTVHADTFVANGTVGASVGYGAFDITFSRVQQTEQYSSQLRDSIYNTIKVGLKF
jgi:hypothetical protein